MENLPVIKFEPLLKSIIWGGRNMATVLNRSLPTDEPYGESWEISDLDGNQSIVRTGDLAGVSIEELLKRYPAAMLGTSSLLDGRFPLLFKFIDAQRTLSVQVHPDESTCKRLKGGARPKTEAWYIIVAQPGAKLYVGLKTGVTRRQFEQSLKDGSVADLLHARQVSRGDFVFLPSGTVHAIGEGIVLAEVQQSSDTTYRVFDWNRVGLDGKPRQLHIEEALASIHFDEFEIPPITPPVSGRPGVRCPFFSMETVQLNSGASVQFENEGPIAVMVTAGQGNANVAGVTGAANAKLGETVFVPAVQSKEVTIVAKGDVTLLVTLVP